MKTTQIVLASRPEGEPKLSDFRFEETELPELKDGEVLLKGLYYSVDPYMRGRMSDEKSYVPSFNIDQPIEGGVIAQVSASKSTHFKTDDMVSGILPWRLQTIASDKLLQKIDITKIPASYYLSVLGMTGLAAYFGLTIIGKPKSGETIIISGAAGAVGMVVGQIAKIHGCHVIGITGTDEKAKLLKEKFGFDETINYRTTPDMNDAITMLCPTGIDIYFDNVGGDISDAVIANMNFLGRISLCGQISLYNDSKIPMGPRVQNTMIKKSLTMQGFIVGNYKTQFPDGINDLTAWVNDGKLKFTETIINGFDQLPKAFLGLFHGENSGKMIVKV